MKSYTDFGRSRTVVSADAEHPFRLMPNSPGSEEKFAGARAGSTRWRRGRPRRHVAFSSLERRTSAREGLRATEENIGATDQEVLRLSAQGLSYHQIGQSVGISRTIVRNYLKRAQQARPELATAR